MEQQKSMMNSERKVGQLGLEPRTSGLWVRHHTKQHSMQLFVIAQAY